MGKRLTYSQAIRSECRYCTNTQALPRNFICPSEVCKLKDLSLTPLKRIRAHCLDCVGTSQEVTRCSGIITRCSGMTLKPKKHLCPLHPYREGHNPKMRGRKRSVKQIENAKKLGERAASRRRMQKLS